MVLAHTFSILIKFGIYRKDYPCVTCNRIYCKVIHVYKRFTLCLITWHRIPFWAALSPISRRVLTNQINEKYFKSMASRRLKFKSMSVYAYSLVISERNLSCVTWILAVAMTDIFIIMLERIRIVSILLQRNIKCHCTKMFSVGDSGNKGLWNCWSMTKKLETKIIHSVNNFVQTKD